VLRNQFVSQLLIRPLTGQMAYSTSFMGYDLHITRRNDWSATGNDITAAEWLAYVERDAELSLWPANGPYMVRWSGKSKHPEPWLDWFKGNVYSKNPDEALIKKMVQIARAFDARVQGDDGEIHQSEQLSLLDRLKNKLRRGS